MKPSNNHFDILAPFYEKVVQPGERFEFWKLVDMPECGSLLDVGGGTGRVSQSVIGSKQSVTVADVSCNMLSEARHKKNLQSVCTPSELLPFANDLFDRVIMVDALHHVAHQADTSAELWRVVKLGGRIIIEEPDITQFWVKLIALGEKLAFMRSHFLNAGQIEELFPFNNAKIETYFMQSNVLIVIEKTSKTNS